MMNSDNIAAIENSHYEYVIGEPLKRQPESIISHFLDKENYGILTISTDVRNRARAILQFKTSKQDHYLYLQHSKSAQR